MKNQELQVFAEFRGDEMFMAFVTPFFTFVLRSSTKQLVKLRHKLPILFGCGAHAAPSVVKGIEDSDGSPAPFDQLEARAIVIKSNVPAVRKDVKVQNIDIVNEYKSSTEINLRPVNAFIGV